MDKYELLDVVGRGAFGVVHLCTRKSDRKQLIVKQLPVEMMTREETKSAVNEAKVLAMLDHPNVIRYFDSFLDDRAMMIVMEYARGGTLQEHLERRQGKLLREKVVLSYFAQLLLALEHIHGKMILHRDLKCQNILMNSRRDIVKIGDFGISKILSTKSKALTVIGTPCYLSPELCDGQPYNQKSDVWALGCVVHEMMTLKRAFEAQTIAALVRRIMQGDVAHPVGDNYSLGLRQLQRTMLRLDPADRPAVQEIMAHPSVMGAVVDVTTDVGQVRGS